MKKVLDLAMIAGIFLILYFQFQIRPQYLFSDLRRSYYNAMQSYQDAKAYFTNPEFYPDKEMKKVEEIAQRFRINSSRVTFKFGTPMYSDRAHNFAAAHCEGNHEIVIDPHRWQRFTYWGREQLIFHELGHCLLEINHGKEKITRNGRKIASSVMNEGGIRDGDYVLNRDYYLRELFDPER